MAVTPEPPLASGPALVITAHPDDAEIAAGATLAKWAAQGRSVHLLILTNGDRGSQDPQQDRAELARIRHREQEASARILGLASFRILDIHDAELQNVAENRAEVVRVIRQLRPTTLLTCDPTTWVLGSSYYYYNHPDHRAAGGIALDSACYAAGNPHFFAEQLREGLQPWSVRDILLAWSHEPNHFQEVTGFVDRKLEALRQHQSQVGAGLYGDYEIWLPKVAAKQGRRIGAQHAEAFRHLTLR
jgi:LmbE family N-acetylglucosaminyl deacetylase